MTLLSDQHNRAGLILAGGRSTRFGEEDKAIAPLAGIPMIRRVTDRLLPVVDYLVINCRSSQEVAIRESIEGISLPVKIRLDPRTDEGPLLGMLAGLRDHPADYTFVCGCDMPFIDPRIVEYLFDQIGDLDAVIPHIAGWEQPLHAVYRTVAMREACETALASDDDRIVHAIDRLEYRVATEDEIRKIGSIDTFDNVNTRDEFEEAKTRIDTST